MGSIKKPLFWSKRRLLYNGVRFCKYYKYSIIYSIITYIFIYIFFLIFHIDDVHARGNWLRYGQIQADPSLSWRPTLSERQKSRFLFLGHKTKLILWGDGDSWQKHSNEGGLRCLLSYLNIQVAFMDNLAFLFEEKSLHQIVIFYN